MELKFMVHLILSTHNYIFDLHIPRITLPFHATYIACGNKMKLICKVKVLHALRDFPFAKK